MQSAYPVKSYSRPHPPVARPPLTERDAIEIWIARWLRVRPSDLIRRYGCDPRRLYEIWQEDRFPGSREKALTVFLTRHPKLVERIDPGPHVRLTRASHPGQLELFD